QIHVFFLYARQRRTFVEFMPDPAVLLVYGNRVAHCPRPFILAKGVRGEQKTADNADGLSQIEPVFLKPGNQRHCPPLYRNRLSPDNSPNESHPADTKFARMCG